MAEEKKEAVNKIDQKKEELSNLVKAVLERNIDYLEKQDKEKVLMVLNTLKRKSYKEYILLQEELKNLALAIETKKGEIEYLTNLEEYFINFN
jgi:hypothetical protein